MRFAAIIVGIVLVLLGGLWLLQGLGVVAVPPILCVAECAPLTGPSMPWAIAGFVMLIAGGGLFAWSRRRRD